MKKFDSALIAAQNSLNNKSAETYVDTGVKILMAVVVGAILIVALIALFDNTILPRVTEKVVALFDQADNTTFTPDYNGTVVTP